MKKNSKKRGEISRGLKKILRLIGSLHIAMIEGDLILAKVIYLRILRKYNGLKEFEKRIVYQDISKLYLQRKRAEKLYGQNMGKKSSIVLKEYYALISHYLSPIKKWFMISVLAVFFYFIFRYLAGQNVVVFTGRALTRVEIYSLIAVPVLCTVVAFVFIMSQSKSVQHIVREQRSKFFTDRFLPFIGLMTGVFVAVSLILMFLIDSLKQGVTGESTTNIIITFFLENRLIAYVITGLIFLAVLLLILPRIIEVDHRVSTIKRYMRGKGKLKKIKKKIVKKSRDNIKIKNYDDALDMIIKIRDYLEKEKLMDAKEKYNFLSEKVKTLPKDKQEVIIPIMEQLKMEVDSASYIYSGKH